MTKLVVTHAVVDVDRWLQGKAERAETEPSLFSQYMRTAGFALKPMLTSSAASVVLPNAS